MQQKSFTRARTKLWQISSRLRGSFRTGWLQMFRFNFQVFHLFSTHCVPWQRSPAMLGSRPDRLGGGLTPASMTEESLMCLRSLHKHTRHKIHPSCLMAKNKWITSFNYTLTRAGYSERTINTVLSLKLLKFLFLMSVLFVLMVTGSKYSEFKYHW